MISYTWTSVKRMTADSIANPPGGDHRRPTPPRKTSAQRCEATEAQRSKVGVLWLSKFSTNFGKISARFRLFKDATDVAVEPSMAGTTREDQEIKHRNVLKSKLRAHPLMPCDPQDTTQPFLDMDSGVRLRQVVFGKFSTRMPKNMRKS